MSQRPLDVLDSVKGDNILVKLKPIGKDQPITVSGKLTSFDVHLNMWLEDATMTEEDSQTQFGKLLIRGDNVMVVSPE